MAGLLPPTPVGVPPGHSFWNDWYEKLRNLINSGAVSTTWANIDFSGSNITDIQNRAHNNLQSFDGGTTGEYYHLTNSQHTALTAGFTGTGNIVRATSPTLVTPVLGAATGTTLNLSGLLTVGSATMLATTTSFTNGAGAAGGTLTNAPIAGNPTKWIPINDNGTTRYIPAW